MSQPYTEFQLLAPSGQTVAVNALTVDMVQPSTDATTFLVLGVNTIEVQGDYATVRDQLINAT